MSHRAAVLGRVARVSGVGYLETAFAAFSMAEYGAWVAILVYAYERGGATESAVVAVCQLVPAAFVAPVAARAIDRRGAANALRRGYCAQAGAYGATAALLFGEAPVASVYATAVIAASAVTATRPAHAAMIARLATETEAVTALTVLSGWVESASVLVGPALAGVLIAIDGPPAAIGCFAAALTIAALLITHAFADEPATGTTAPRRRPGASQTVAALLRDHGRLVPLVQPVPADQPHGACGSDHAPGSECGGQVTGPRGAEAELLGDREHDEQHVERADDEVLRRDQQHERDEPTMVSQQCRNGLRGTAPRRRPGASQTVAALLRDHGRLVPLVLLVATQYLVIGALDVLLVVLAISELGLGASGAGYLTAAFGAGGMIGSAGAVWLIGRHRLGGPLSVAALAWGSALALLGVWPTVAGAFLLLAAAGSARSLLDTSGRTILIRVAPDAARGEVFGLLEGASMVALAIGSGLVPMFVTIGGARMALIVIGGLLWAITVTAGAAVHAVEGVEPSFGQLPTRAG